MGGGRPEMRLLHHSADTKRWRAVVRTQHRRVSSFCANERLVEPGIPCPFRHQILLRPTPTVHDAIATKHGRFVSISCMASSSIGNDTSVDALKAEKREIAITTQVIRNSVSTRGHLLPRRTNLIDRVS